MTSRPVEPQWVSGKGRFAIATLVLLVLLSVPRLRLPSLVLAEDTIDQALGGRPISKDQYHYFTAITSVDGRFRCSGVLIGQRFVATAAHCVGTDIDSTHVDVGYYCVQRDNCGRPHQSISIDSIAILPNGDFAILTLERAPHIVPPIRPVALDLKGKILKKMKKNAKMTLVGGGQAEAGVVAASTIVQELKVRYIPQKKCRKSGLTRDLSGMICSIPVGGTKSGPCRGDSGGPIVVRRKKVDYLVAVHSFGKKICGQRRTKPDGHFSVQAATKLIRSVICGGPYPEDWCSPKDKDSTSTPPSPRFSLTFAIFWPVTSSSTCTKTSLGQLLVTCTGTDATLSQPMDFRPVSKERVTCSSPREETAQLSCQAETSRRDNFDLTTVLFVQCTAPSQDDLTVEASIGQTVGNCADANDESMERNLTQSLSVVPVCEGSLLFTTTPGNGEPNMECDNARALIPLNDNDGRGGDGPAYTCGWKNTCSSDTCGELQVDGVVVRYTAPPPDRCICSC